MSLACPRKRICREPRADWQTPSAELAANEIHTWRARAGDTNRSTAGDSWRLSPTFHRAGTSCFTSWICIYISEWGFCRYNICMSHTLHYVCVCVFLHRCTDTTGTQLCTRFIWHLDVMLLTSWVMPRAAWAVRSGERIAFGFGLWDCY